MLCHCHKNYVLPLQRWWDILHLFQSCCCTTCTSIFLFWRGISNQLQRGSAWLKLPCVMVRCSHPGNSKPCCCNDGNYNRQERKTSTWSPHWFPPSQEVAMLRVTQTNSKGPFYIKKTLGVIWESSNSSDTFSVDEKTEFLEVEVWTLKLLNSAAPLHLLRYQANEEIEFPFINRNLWGLHRSTKLGQTFILAVRRICDNS